MPTARRRLLAIAVAAVAGACTFPRAPVLEVAQARFSNPQVTLPERTAQIERAASGLGWRTERLEPRRIRATFPGAGGMTAIVRLDFDTATFSIRYEDSRNLDYANGSISQAYNGNVADLREAIIAQSGV